MAINKKVPLTAAQRKMIAEKIKANKLAQMKKRGVTPLPQPKKKKKAPSAAWRRWGTMSNGIGVGK